MSSVKFFFFCNYIFFGYLQYHHSEFFPYKTLVESKSPRPVNGNKTHALSETAQLILTFFTFKCQPAFDFFWGGKKLVKKL